MATWGSLLEFCPSNAPTLQYKPARASTLSYSAIDAPGEAQFLRQSNADSLEQDFVSRIISAFREELSQRGLLDSSLPEAVLNAMGILDNTIGTAVLRTEEETWIMLGYWVAAVRAILRAMLNRDDEVLHQSTPKNVFSQIGDCDLTIVKKGQEDPLKSISIQCRIPAALATHSEELAQPHTFKPEMQTNGRAMLVKLDLQVEHNSPAHVGIIFDGLRATFVEHLILDPVTQHRAAVVSKCHGVVPSTSPPPFPQFPAYSSGRNNIPFLAILVFLLLPRTIAPMPTLPTIVNPIQSTNLCKPPPLKFFQGPSEPEVRDDSDGEEEDGEEDEEEDGSKYNLITRSWSSSLAESSNSSGSDCEGTTDMLLTGGMYAFTYEGFFGLARIPVIFKFYRKDYLARRLFRVEARAYSLLSRVCPEIIPQFHGRFWLEDDTSVLVLENAGKSLTGDMWGDVDLAYYERVSIYGILKTLHEQGLEHGDFEPRNVLRRTNSTFCVIDFQFAVMDHVCPGEYFCDELSETRRILKIGGDDEDVQ